MTTITIEFHPTMISVRKYEETAKYQPSKSFHISQNPKKLLEYLGADILKIWQEMEKALKVGGND